MKINKKTKKAGMVVAIISVVLIVLLGVFGTGMLEPSVAKPDFPSEHLFVDATYLLKTGETNDTVNITCNLYLTNIWEKESGEIKVTAYVIETTDNLAVYKNTVEVGEIAAEATAEIEIPIVLSNSSYKVEILVFENQKLVIKGKLTISAYPVYSWDDIAHGTRQEWKVSNSLEVFDQIR